MIGSVFEAGGFLRASSAAGLEDFLQRQHGIVETVDVVLMKSDPVGILRAIALSRATVRKMRQNLWWAVGYNTIAFPIAAGLLYPSIGLLLRPEIAAISMAGSSFLVAVNALLLKRTKLEGIRRYGAQ